MAIETTLTIKQRNFCHEYVKNGGNGIEAYLAAYDTESRKAANVESCKLLQRDDITAYLQALYKPSKNKAINEREKKRQFLWDMINDPESDNNDKLRAMDILNKMDQEYINITRTEDNKTDISNIDTATLHQLASGKTNTSN